MAHQHHPLCGRGQLVVIESPYAGDVIQNVRYARLAMADALRRGEAPLASHLLYTQPEVLDDAVPAERQRGIDAGVAWAAHADLVVFYVDLGWSSGMCRGQERAVRAGQRMVKRWLDYPERDEEIGCHPDCAPATPRCPAPCGICDGT